jgi:hypothetical protein
LPPLPPHSPNGLEKNHSPSSAPHRGEAVAKSRQGTSPSGIEKYHSYGGCAEKQHGVSHFDRAQSSERRSALLTKGDGGGARALDDLAMGLDTGSISRGKAIKLAGAAVATSALGLFASRGAEGQTVSIAARRRRCLRRGGDFCRRSGCSACCGEGGRRLKACCGPKGCACCTRNERCDRGACRKVR